jgi:hypothetical protein
MRLHEVVLICCRALRASGLSDAEHLHQDIRPVPCVHTSKGQSAFGTRVPSVFLVVVK